MSALVSFGCNLPFTWRHFARFDAAFGLSSKTSCAHQDGLHQREDGQNAFPSSGMASSTAIMLLVPMPHATASGFRKGSTQERPLTASTNMDLRKISHLLEALGGAAHVVVGRGAVVPRIGRLLLEVHVARRLVHRIHVGGVCQLHP